MILCMFSYHIKEMREGNQFMYSLLSSRGCKFLKVIRAEDQATKPVEPLSLFCKELFILLLVSRFCMSNRAEKQVAFKMRMYLVMPEYLTDQMRYSGIQQIRCYQCSS